MAINVLKNLGQTDTTTVEYLKSSLLPTQWLYKGERQFKIHIQQGVPQGGVLSPSLFNVVINPLMELNEYLTDEKATILGYADDLLQCSYNNNEVVKTMRMIHTWCTKSNLKMNGKKLQYIKITSPHARSQKAIRSGNFEIDKLKIRWDGTEIEKKNEMNYLGVTIDHKLSFYQHRMRLENNIKKGYEDLQLIFKMSLPWKTKLFILNTYIIPKALYGIELIDKPEKIDEAICSTISKALKPRIGTKAERVCKALNVKLPSFFHKFNVFMRYCRWKKDLIRNCPRTEVNDESENHYFASRLNEVTTFFEKYSIDPLNTTMKKLKKKIKYSLEDELEYPHITMLTFLKTTPNNQKFRTSILAKTVWTRALRKRIFPNNRVSNCECNDESETTHHTVDICTRLPVMRQLREKLHNSITKADLVSQDEIRESLYEAALKTIKKADKMNKQILSIITELESLIDKRNNPFS
eukprot:CAMPEP_0115009308 /NCGR_PEP_ID=MMETSP0216-20121206/22528_1 /TAXON_ID=223996 /ORGANISM="Protocruzia adherens, Strain Boccale" /LENGTH=466 /DNA_ID=CAMNT_0002377077 /DNA_START=433 /DNA_END=1833 /DNA_ORIENTATION=-